MKYRPTPLNILSTILIGWTIWTYNPKVETMGYGEMAVMFLVGFGVCGLFVDLTIQWFSRKYLLTFGIEMILILTLGTSYSYSQRTKTLIIPDSLTSQYIVTVYGVKNKPRLTDKIFPWTYEIEVPESGILLTSSSFGSDLPETKIISYSEKESKSDSSDWGWKRFSEDEFNCDGKTYRYRSWMVDKEFCCAYSSDEADSLRVKLQKQLCNELN